MHKCTRQQSFRGGQTYRHIYIGACATRYEYAALMSVFRCISRYISYVLTAYIHANAYVVSSSWKLKIYNFRPGSLRLATCDLRRTIFPFPMSHLPSFCGCFCWLVKISFQLFFVSVRGRSVTHAKSKKWQVKSEKPTNRQQLEMTPKTQIDARWTGADILARVASCRCLNKPVTLSRLAGAHRTSRTAEEFTKTL